MCLERLAAPHFPMYENLSADTVGPRSNNLIARRLDQLVVEDDFAANNGLSEQYKKEHKMIKDVEVSRRIAYHEIIVCLQFCEMPRDCSKEDQETLSMDVDCDLNTELKDCATLNDVKFMGSIVNPLFLNNKGMIAA
jgi:hypothetical protein